MKRKQIGRNVSLMGSALVFLAAVPVEAATKLRDVTSGNWTNATEWYTDGVPGSADSVYIGSSNVGGVTPATCILDTAGQQCDRFYVGHQAGNIGQFDFIGGDLTVIGAGIAPQVCIGYSGTGTVNQTLGTWNNSGKTLNIGFNDGSYGEYNISQGAITNMYSMYVGNNGVGVLNLGESGVLGPFSGESHIGYGSSSTGVVNQTGGTWNGGGQHIRIGSGVGSVGTVTISSGSLTNANYIYAGNLGNGTLNISSNAVVKAAKLYISNAASSVGVLSITGSSASIQAVEFRGGNPGSATLRITPDSGGISPIVVTGGNKTWIHETVLEVDFSNYNSTNDLTIINCGTLRADAVDGDYDFLDVILTPRWSAEVDYFTGGKVRLINIKRPPKGTLISFF